MPLNTNPIDHIALVLQNQRELRKIWQYMYYEDFPIIEPVHLWPDDIPGCPNVPESDKKWMTTIKLTDFLLVLLAPHNNIDIMSKFLKKTKTSEVHHFAFQTHDIHTSLQDSIAIGGIKQMSPLVSDSLLKQVFLTTEDDFRITEIIQRYSNFEGTFTCKNIMALTMGERKFKETEDA